MFETNNLNFKKINNFFPIYEMENFYKNPNEILIYLNQNPPFPHKWYLNTNNLNYFSDLRHEILNNDIEIVEKKLINYFNLKGKEPKKTLRTNLFRMNCSSFNDYKNNYWYPHTDFGQMTFIIYLNPNGCDGTNFYSQEKEFKIDFEEHNNPWVSKSIYKLLLNVPSKYNKCIAFETENFLHGMAINSGKFFKKFRLNQPIFI